MSGRALIVLSIQTWKAPLGSLGPAHAADKHMCLNHDRSPPDRTTICNCSLYCGGGRGCVWVMWEKVNEKSVKQQDFAWVNHCWQSENEHFTSASHIQRQRVFFFYLHIGRLLNPSLQLSEFAQPPAELVACGTDYHRRRYMSILFMTFFITNTCWFLLYSHFILKVDQSLAE